MFKKENKVFLGGTCNDSKWRRMLIEHLAGRVDYFDPVVPNWNEEAYKRELREMKTCDYLLFTITPKMTGVYSIAEVVEASNKTPEKTIFCILNSDDGLSFDEGQRRSLDKVGVLVKNNGGVVFDNLLDVARYLLK